MSNPSAVTTPKTTSCSSDRVEGCPPRLQGEAMAAPVDPVGVVAETGGKLARYDAMCRAIDAAYEVDEVKGIRDKAIAFETYARMAKNIEAERRACEIRLRAERKAGQLLATMEKAKGAREAGTKRGATRSRDATASLSELGISKSQSSRWQQLADVPEEQFESALASPEKPSTTGIIGKKPKPMDPQALWLWGRLRDFERDGILARATNELLNEMTDAMQADVRRLAAPVAAWLNEICAATERDRGEPGMAHDQGHPEAKSRQHSAGTAASPRTSASAPDHAAGLPERLERDGGGEAAQHELFPEL